MSCEIVVQKQKKNKQRHKLNRNKRRMRGGGEFDDSLRQRHIDSKSIFGLSVALN